MRMNKTRIVLFVVLVLGVIGLWIFWRRASDTKEIHFVRMAYGMFHGLRGHIKVRGTVVDENGQKLQGVNLSLTVGKTKLLGLGSEDSYEKRTVNGDYSVGFSDCSSVELFFYKEGYYDAKVFFRVKLSPEDENALSTGGKIAPKNVETNNVTVVLEKMKSPTYLKSFTEEIEFTPSTGSGRVVIIDPSSKSQRGKVISVSDVRDVQHLAANCFAIIAETDSDGKMPTVHYPGPQKTVPRDYPKKLHIIANTADGGFVVFPQKGHDLSRYMRTAPAEGYQREIVYDEAFYAEQATRGDGEGEGLWIYCKMGGWFAKGRLSRPDIVGSNVSVRIVLRIQPDGSRNLETKE
jgi:hypothetical protein